MKENDRKTEYFETDIPEESYEIQKDVRTYNKSMAIRIVIIEILTFAVLVGVAVAWFIKNDGSGTKGISMSTVGDLFSIEPVSATGYHAGIYDDPSKMGTNRDGTYVRDILLEKASKTDDIITWTITDDEAVEENNVETVIKGKNMGNGPVTGSEGGIRPGSSGEIQFVIGPNQPVQAEFLFYVYAYTGGYDEQGDDDKTSIELIENKDGMSAEALIGQKLLNGHILLFSDLDKQTGKYSGLIGSGDDFVRLMEKVYTAEETVSIYWIWPETLAEVVFDENVPGQARYMRGKKNICSSTGKTELIQLIKEHPDWFFLDPADSGRDWSDVLDEDTTDEAVISTINSNYVLYSSYYNEADQCIGTNVSYILLDMASGGAAVDPGDNEPSGGN